MDVKKTRLVDKQRIIVLLFTLAMIILGCAINLSGIGGPEGAYFQWMNSGFLCVAVVSFVLFCFHKLSSIVVCSLLIVATLLETSAEMIFCSFRGESYDLMLIAGNMTFLVIIILLPMMAYIRYLSYAMGAISLIIYGLCVWITRNGALESFFYIYLPVVVLISILSDLWVRNFNELEHENTDMKKEGREVLDLLNMDRHQLASLIELSKDRQLTMQQTEHLLELIGGHARTTIIERVKQLMVQKQTKEDSMHLHFPELSHSELEICQLIVRDKKQGEICRLLHKSPSNITCQRSNIRRKLNLRKGEDLKHFLSCRLEKPI